MKAQNVIMKYHISKVLTPQQSNLQAQIVKVYELFDREKCQEEGLLKSVDTSFMLWTHLQDASEVYDKDIQIKDWEEKVKTKKRYLINLHVSFDIEEMTYISSLTKNIVSTIVEK